jgi:hypothetical protein
MMRATMWRARFPKTDNFDFSHVSAGSYDLWKNQEAFKSEA